MRLVDDARPRAPSCSRRCGRTRARHGCSGSRKPGRRQVDALRRLIGSYRARGHRVGVVAVDPSSPYRAARSSATASACRATRPTTACSSGPSRPGPLGGSDAERARRRARPRRDRSRRGHRRDRGRRARRARDHPHGAFDAGGDGARNGRRGAGDQGRILECADVFAVNKADREGADAAVRDLELMISLGNESIRALSKMRGHATHGSADGFVRADAPARPGGARRTSAGRRQSSSASPREATASPTSWARSTGIAPGSRGRPGARLAAAHASPNRCASRSVSRSSRRPCTTSAPASTRPFAPSIRAGRPLHRHRGPRRCVSRAPVRTARAPGRQEKERGLHPISGRRPPCRTARGEGAGAVR